MTVHVFFDREFCCHVCEFHRDLARSLACPDQDEDGDCAHVQHTPCDCTEVFPCAICPDGVALGDIWAESVA